MITHGEALVIVFGMYAVTIILRWLPMVIVGRFTVPRQIERWLGYVPAALFAAILVQGVMPAQALGVNSELLAQWAAVGAALLSTLRTRSMLWGAGAGAAVLFGVRWWL